MPYNTDHFENNEIMLRSYQDDIVDGIYKIHTERLVNELSNQFCRYYFATHLKSEKEYFAIVFERSFNPNIRAIDILKHHHINNINKLHSYSLVKLSSSHRYQIVVIVEAYNPFETLQNHIEEYGPMDSLIVKENLIPALIKCIEFCNTHGLHLGNINPQNIIVTKNNDFILKEFISTLPNFYQPLTYLAPEISDAIPIGRITNSHSIDIYALGMTIYYAISGLTINFAHHDERLFNAKRIEEGSYNVISYKIKIPKALRLFLLSTLNDNPLYRWNNAQLSDWLSIVQEKTMKNHTKAVGHTILFEGYNYSHPESLAAAMYSFYDAGIKLCQDENFIRWIQKSKGKIDNLENYIMFNNNSNRLLSSVVDTEKEEMILQVFSMLDAFSPIRAKDFCITLESIPHILFMAIYSDNKALYEQLSKILRRNYWKIILTPEYKDKISYDYLDKITNLSSAFISNPSYYGGKQQLYLSDQYVPCLSPTVIADYVLSIDDLLVSLDKIAAHTPSKLLIDEHIAAFISSRLPSDSNLEAKLNSENELFSKSIMLEGISLLAVAQEHSHNIKIPHLCSILAQKLIEWINDNLHSIKLKKVITSEIAELASSGSLSQILYVISNPQLFQNDYRGYKVAHMQVVSLNDTIKNLSNDDQVYELGISLGQKLTVLVSYFLCMLVALILII